MAEMGAAARALDFCALAVGVAQSTDRPDDLFIETRPATTGVELGFGTVEGRPAAFASIGPELEVMVVLSGEGRLGSFVSDDSLLLTRELPPSGLTGRLHVSEDALGRYYPRPSRAYPFRL